MTSWWGSTGHEPIPDHRLVRARRYMATHEAIANVDFDPCGRRSMAHGGASMSFLRTYSETLIAIVDVAQIFELEENGARTIVAVLRDGTRVRLARDYSMAALAKALDPVRR